MEEIIALHQQHHLLIVSMALLIIIITKRMMLRLSENNCLKRALIIIVQRQTSKIIRRLHQIFIQLKMHWNKIEIKGFTQEITINDFTARENYILIFQIYIFV